MDSCGETIVQKPGHQVLESNQCKVCGIPAIGSNFGIMSCQPCKMFFKRNAHRKDSLKCDFDGNCEININNRHVCSYCRLVKCFKSGMQVERLRCSTMKKNKIKRNMKDNKNPLQKTSKELVRFNTREQFPTVNLLQTDQSTLTLEQWNHLSNLSHCYDEHSGLALAINYMNEQSRLAPKLRFKPERLTDLVVSVINKAELLYKNNQDFLSLDTHDRSILLHHTIKYVAGLTSHFIYRQIRLLDHPSCIQSLGLLFGENTIVAAKQIDSLFNFDAVIIKLLLGLLTFSTMNYTFYSTTNTNNLKNLREVLHIQDTYAELTWRYLLYKSSHDQAVVSFSNLIRCLFTLHNIIVHAYEVEQCTHIIDDAVQRTKQSLSLND